MPLFSRIFRLLKLAAVSAIFANLVYFLPAFSANFDEINKQIKEKQESVKKIEAEIQAYEKAIRQKQTEAVTLSNQMSILDSRVAKAELDIQITEIEIDELVLEIDFLAAVIEDKEAKIGREKEILASLIRKIGSSDSQKKFLIFSGGSFSRYFEQVRHLESLSEELGRVLRRVKIDKAEFENRQSTAKSKKEDVEKLKNVLEERKDSLEEQKKAKNYLLAQTRSSESKFRVLLAQLRQEYSQIDQEIFSLQRQLEKKLKEADDLGESGVFSWPVSPEKGLTVSFRDPTYPFRYLFEHSGIDIRASQGTPVAAAAPGYVVWTRNSRLYGNNILLVHRDGLATLYAHLSKMTVSEDQFVKRGQLIGNSGGMPGTPGAGFSTGPHLHFEIRENGIPVDPMRYLR